MALKLSQSDVMELKDRAERLANRARSAVAKADEVIAKAVRTSEVSLAAFGMGLAQGRYGSVEVMGVPMDLGAGLGLHLLGFAGVGGRHSDHLHGFGDGALASYLTTLGKGIGAGMRAKAGLPPVSVKGSLSNAEIDALRG